MKHYATSIAAMNGPRMDNVPMITLAPSIYEVIGRAHEEANKRFPRLDGWLVIVSIVCFENPEERYTN